MNPRVALVYAKDAACPPAGMDMIRWIEIGRHLVQAGCRVHLVTDQPGGVRQLAGLPVIDAASADWDEYAGIKVCYQHSIDIVPEHPSIIVRMCRVVDEHSPRRDAGRRQELLRQQARVAERAGWVALNGPDNADRWRRLYGERQQILNVPTGCPESIPAPGQSPFPDGRRIVLYCGALTAPRFPGALNAVARRLRDKAADIEVHFVGRDRLHCYSGSSEPLDPDLVHAHPSVDASQAWRYILHADVGLALSPSTDVFECELAKIYYYLRGGLPTVTESTALNRCLIEETGHGAVARYDDPDELARCALEALSLKRRHPQVMAHMAANHSWRRRAAVYVDAFGLATGMRTEGIVA